MPRQQSDATKLRHAKREIRELRAKLESLGVELLKRRLIGAQMANVCFNVAQGKTLSDYERDIISGVRQEWDAIQRVKGI